MKLFVRSCVLALTLLAATALTALAGGWAVVTVDNLPDQVVSGQAFDLGFIVRQHGRTLRDDLTPILHFGRVDAKASFDVTAKREGESGHYRAAVTFPTDGQWNWRVDIEQFGMVTQEMPPFNVLASAPPVAANTALPVVAGLAGSIGAVLALVLWFHTHTRWALALAVVAATIGVLGIVTTNSGAALATSNTPVALSDRGKALFLAKGCVMCHANANLRAGDRTFSLGDAQPPNLTHVQLSADYLRKWLGNPAALKPGTAMPTLNLKLDEIEALIAFLKQSE